MHGTTIKEAAMIVSPLVNIWLRYFPKYEARALANLRDFFYVAVKSA